MVELKATRYGKRNRYEVWESRAGFGTTFYVMRKQGQSNGRSFSRLDDAVAAAEEAARKEG